MLPARKPINACQGARAAFFPRRAIRASVHRSSAKRTPKPRRAPELRFRSCPMRTGGVTHLGSPIAACVGARETTAFASSGSSLDDGWNRANPRKAGCCPAPGSSACPYAAGRSSQKAPLRGSRWRGKIRLFPAPTFGAFEERHRIEIDINDVPGRFLALRRNTGRAISHSWRGGPRKQGESWKVC